MRRPSPLAAPARLAALLAVLVPGLMDRAALAAPSEKEQHVRREIVVVGSEPVHRRMILDRLADRSYLGVQLLELTPELRRHLGAPDDSGVLVAKVVADSPAEAAGVRVGDVITAIDGEPLRTAGQLVGRVSRRDEGEQVELEVYREAARLMLSATLAKAERRQVEVGQFVWRGGEEGPFAADIDPERFERVIAVDPETINESVRRLLERLEAEGGLAGRSRLEDEQRRRLERRIAELEDRLRELERQLRRRHDGSD